MNVELKSDIPVTDAACKEVSGKTLKEWVDLLIAHPENRPNRREALQWLYGEFGKGRDMWWPTTIWVEFERDQGNVKKDGRLEGYNICCTKTINAPVERVFEAWSNGDLATWFGDGASADATGSITDKNGHRGELIRKRDNKDLRYAWQTAGSPDPTEVDVTFAISGGKPGITLMHNRIQTREEADGLRRGWSEAFNRLKAMLESK